MTKECFYFNIVKRRRKSSLHYSASRLDMVAQNYILPEANGERISMLSGATEHETVKSASLYLPATQR